MKSSVILKFLKHHWILNLSLFLFCVRVFPVLRNPSLWAEDANVYYGPLIKDSSKLLGLDFSIYANQYWVLIHGIAAIVFKVFSNNLEFLPFGSTLVSLFIVLLAGASWLKSKNLVTNQKNREKVFGFILLAPSSWESLGNLSNAYVYFFIGIFALAGWDLPKSRRNWLVENIILVLLALTSICSIFIVLALLFRAYFNRSKSIFFLCGVYSIFVLMQIQQWSQRGPEVKSVEILITLRQVIYIILKRVGAETLIGQNGGIYFSSTFDWRGWLLISTFVLLLFCSSFILFFKYCDETFLIRLSGVLLLGGLHFILALTASIKIGLPILFDFGAGGRYFLVTHVVLFISFIIVFEGFKQLIAKKDFKLLRAILYTIFAVGICFDYLLRLKTNYAYEIDWKDYSNCILNSELLCSVTIPPGGNWGIP